MKINIWNEIPGFLVCVIDLIFFFSFSSLNFQVFVFDTYALYICFPPTMIHKN